MRAAARRQLSRRVPSPSPNGETKVPPKNPIIWSERALGEVTSNSHTSLLWKRLLENTPAWNLFHLSPPDPEFPNWATGDSSPHTAWTRYSAAGHWFYSRPYIHHAPPRATLVLIIHRYHRVRQSRPNMAAAVRDLLNNPALLTRERRLRAGHILQRKQALSILSGSKAFKCCPLLTHWVNPDDASR